MKLLLFIFFIVTCQVFGQVGIGTTEPTATLDINGNLRIRSIQEETNEKIAADSILVISRDGTVHRITSKKVYESNIKTAIRGNFSDVGSNISITLGSDYAIIPFNELVFDLNNEFDALTHTFTAKQDGIYQIYAQINSSGGIAASTDYGIQILKGTEVIAQENFTNLNINLGLINLNITPPIRNVQSLVQLTEGESIQFRLFANLLSVNLLSSKSDSFFTIHQIR